MEKTRKRKREPIPGYRLLELLGRGGFGEVWKCVAPGGLFKAIKFIEGDRNHLHDIDAPAQEELQAIQHIKSLRHPFLLSMERVEWINGELVIVMELADKSLKDVFRDYRGQGALGIPRNELLGYLQEVADVLDYMNLHHGLQHLDIKPDNVFRVSNHVKVADFGLVRSLTDARTATSGQAGYGASDPSTSCHSASSVGRIVGGLTACYAAPELFRDTVSASCDQYSLAIVYQELFTGTRPFHGKNLRQLMIQHCTATPDLSALSEDDRAVSARALAKKPHQRFPTCTDFVRALLANDSARSATVSITETVHTLSGWTGEKEEKKDRSGESSPEGWPTLPTERRTGLYALVAGLMVEAKGDQPALTVNHEPAALPSTGVLQGRFAARFAASQALSGLETFRRQWNAQLVHEGKNYLVFQIPFPTRFWARWLEGSRGLVVEVQWASSRSGRARVPEFAVSIHGCDKKNQDEQKLACEVGPLVLDSLRSHLDAYPERRTQERVEWPHPVRAIFLLGEKKCSEPVQGRGKDLSLGGMGLYLPRAFAGTQVQLDLRRPSNGEHILLLGNCVRVQLCSDGWFETGVLF
jgi:serine/threonine protein kinase